jgi:hypothetical protein
VDKYLGELLEVADSVGARWLVTADHGNADDMVQRDKKGKPLVSDPAHSFARSHSGSTRASDLESSFCLRQGGRAWGSVHSGDWGACCVRPLRQEGSEV